MESSSAPSRVAPLDPPYPAETQDAFDRVMRGAPPLLLFRIVARNPRVLSRLFAGGLLDRGSISLRQRELMILRTTALCGAEYEWGVHVAAFSTAARWTRDEVRSTVPGVAAAVAWHGDERLILRLADELHTDAAISDGLWQELEETFAADQLIELIMLAGFYHAVSFLAKGLRIPLERDAPRFPDRPARAPR